MIRYHRQTILPEIGVTGQDKLSKARILCIGAGGLGCPALQYLAAAGVGHIGIIDHDTVEESNLQRQILYRNDQIGHNKASAAAANLSAQNPHITITPYPEKLTATNAEALFAQYDIIIDGTDNFDSKFLINDAAYKTGKPMIYGTILAFEGQLAVFNHKKGPCYRCLFPARPQQNIANCAEAGVIGALAGIIGSAQAMEAIKIIINTPELSPLNNALWTINTKTMQSQTIGLPKDPACPTCSQPKETITMTQLELTVAESQEKLSANPNALLIDVREENEWNEGHIEGAQHLPLSLLQQGHLADLPKDKEILLYCLRGFRSMQALHILQAQGYEQLQSMKGGYTDWVNSAT